MQKSIPVFFTEWNIKITIIVLFQVEPIVYYAYFLDLRFANGKVKMRKQNIFKLDEEMNELR